MNKTRIKRIINKIRERIDEYSLLSDAKLAAKSDEFKKRLNNGETLNSLLEEAFAAICEADRRILGKMPYDSQIFGAVALHYGYLAEMNTGEGKTLTATLPLYLNALTGKSCILVTANPYLAERDAEEMGPVYEFMGLSIKTGVSMDDEEGVVNKDKDKKEIYSADIVYTTHGSLGFDYLLNNLVKSAEERYLREFYYIIIDEADSVLLDAAQTPLVISGAPHVQSNLYEMTDFFVTSLKEDEDYIVDDKKVWLTEQGVKFAEEYFDIDNFYANYNFELNRHVTLALRAHTIFEKEKNYVVSDKNEIVLLDRGTGRLLNGMKLRGGQHQALEIKEKIKLTNEYRSMASITYQNFFLLFPKMAGMSGTMDAARGELFKVYKKRVMVIPPNKPVIRVDYPDVFFSTADKQYQSAIAEVVERHKKGQPVLLITSTIADTEKASRMLVEEKVPHSVLNANNTFWEAQIIKEAGKIGAVTVSTGMAGRGTDIKLEEGAQELGGLAVIGVGRMDNVRLEKQVRGRSGRQGDPGMSKFFVSLEDEVSKAAGEKVYKKYVEKEKRIGRIRLKRLINGAQRLTEEKAVEARKQAVDYDKILKRQRNTIYGARDRLLDGESLKDGVIEEMFREDISRFLKENKNPTIHQITRYVLDTYKYQIEDRVLNLEGLSKKRLYKELSEYVSAVWIKRQNELFDENIDINDFKRRCALQAIDESWIEQVDYLQQLQFVVSGRTTAQKKPLFEYHNEASFSFERMQRTIRRDIIRYVFLSKVEYDKDGNMLIWYP